VKIGFVRHPSPAPGRTQVPSSYCLTSLRFWLRSDTFQPSWVRLPGVSDADLAGRAGPDGCRRSRCVQIAMELTRHSQYPTRWVTCARRRPCFRKYQAFPRRTPPPSRGAEGAERKERKGPPTFCKGKGYQPSGPREMWMAPTSRLFRTGRPSSTGETRHRRRMVVFPATLAMIRPARSRRRVSLARGMCKGWLTGFEPAISRSTIGPDGPSEQTPNPYAISILASSGPFARGRVPSRGFARNRGIPGVKTVENGSVKSST